MAQNVGVPVVRKCSDQSNRRVQRSCIVGSVSEFSNSSRGSRVAADAARHSAQEVRLDVRRSDVYVLHVKLQTPSCGSKGH